MLNKWNRSVCQIHLSLLWDVNILNNNHPSIHPLTLTCMGLGHWCSSLTISLATSSSRGDTGSVLGPVLVGHTQKNLHIQVFRRHAEEPPQRASLDVKDQQLHSSPLWMTAILTSIHVLIFLAHTHSLRPLLRVEVRMNWETGRILSTVWIVGWDLEVPPIGCYNIW